MPAGVEGGKVVIVVVPETPNVQLIMFRPGQIPLGAVLVLGDGRGGGVVVAWREERGPMEGVVHHRIVNFHNIYSCFIFLLVPL